MPDEASQALAALVERRRQVVGMLTAEKNRYQQALPAVRPHRAAPIAWLEQALKDLDAELDAELDAGLRASPLWRERERLLRRVPGVGPTLSLTLLALLAHLPELGSGSVKRVATLVGLAPLNCATQPRQWRLARQPRDLGWPAAGAGSALHGRAGRGPPQPGPAQLL